MEINQHKNLLPTLKKNKDNIRKRDNIIIMNKTPDSDVLA